MLKKSLKYLFIINDGSGRHPAQYWVDLISDFFEEEEDSFDIYHLPQQLDQKQIKDRVLSADPQRAIAVGGDGTITMLANILVGSKIALGVLPAGSANGMAKELGIPADAKAALEIIKNGQEKCIDLVQVNKAEYFLHLSDIGLNAQLIKYFDQGKLRGKLGYGLVIIKTLWNRQKMNVHVRTDEEQIIRNAFMVALANARMYGTGAVINPDGKLDDGKFEIVIIRKLSFLALLKMLFRPGNFNPQHIEIFQCTTAEITATRPVHFQIDGEYKGKTRSVSAEIKHDAVKMILPRDEKKAE